ncbi:MAG: catalase [Clostridia bacterium]|nr:catalase [Clostridia bacterium]
MKNLIGHFVTITKHRHLVIRHCRKAGILWQGLRHDLSKYSPTEFLPGVKYYTGQRSPNEGERAENGFSLAWIHHKGRNRHHFEYWTDYSPVSKLIEPVEMPVRYVAEMFCDRVAAGKIYNGDKYTDDSPLEYFMKAKHRRVIHPKTSDLLESLLVMLKDYGEEYTFEYLRRIVNEDKRNKEATNNKKL